MPEESPLGEQECDKPELQSAGPDDVFQAEEDSAMADSAPRDRRPVAQDGAKVRHAAGSVRQTIPCSPPAHTSPRVVARVCSTLDAAGGARGA